MVTEAKITVELESVHTADALGLIEQLSRELAVHYVDGRKGSGDFRPTDMDVPRACFVVARLDGIAMGCGAIRPWDDDPTHMAEVKRMFVQPDVRGRGISRLILARLEEAARDHGYVTTILETGDRQLEAIGLYEKAGYTRCDCWGKYSTSAWSLCYRKALPVIESLDAAGAIKAINDLTGLLYDAVNNGASVGFLPPLDMDTARRYWADEVIPALSTGQRVLLVAKLDGHMVGTAQLVLIEKANGPHRAEVVRVLVHSTQRRHGLGRALMRAIETHAQRLGRTTLVLDTRTGDSGERLYRSLGWVHVGDIPDYVINEKGVLEATSIYYRLFNP